MRTFRAPGRVNLCGEHTDYNQGYVLPAAIDLECRARIDAADDGELRFESSRFGDGYSVRIADLPTLRRRGHWSDYAAGVAKEMALAGLRVPAAMISIDSSVPIGSGLASSAALEVAVACALLDHSDRTLTRIEIAKLCLDAERNFVGMQCGIMDQFVSLHGAADRAVLLDCRSLEFRLVSLPRDVEIVVVNSGVKHELASSAYNDRVRECAEACRQLGVDSLRDLAAEEWPAVEAKLSGVAKKRARHVVHENARVLAFVDACERNDLDALRRIMRSGHRSLADDYEVSCPELDFLVEAASSIDGVVGARMTGGGFGGCTANLVETAAVDLFAGEIIKKYTNKFDRRPRIYSCKASDGAGELTSSRALKPN